MFWHQSGASGPSCPFSHTAVHKLGCHSSCLAFGLWLCSLLPSLEVSGLPPGGGTAKLSAAGGLYHDHRYFRALLSAVLHSSRGQRHWASLSCHSWLGKGYNVMVWLPQPFSTSGMSFALLQLHQGPLHNSGNSRSEPSPRKRLFPDSQIFLRVLLLSSTLGLVKCYFDYTQRWRLKTRYI